MNARHSVQSEAALYLLTRKITLLRRIKGLFSYHAHCTYFSVCFSSSFRAKTNIVFGSLQNMKQYLANGVLGQKQEKGFVFGVTELKVYSYIVKMWQLLYTDAGICEIKYIRYFLFFI